MFRAIVEETAPRRAGASARRAARRPARTTSWRAASVPSSSSSPPTRPRSRSCAATWARSASASATPCCPPGSGSSRRTCARRSPAATCRRRRRLPRARHARGRARARPGARRARPPDVEGATAFVTALFRSGRRRPPRRYAAASCAPASRLLIAVLALLAVPVAAQAKLTVGIAENNPGMFGDPFFTSLKAKHARVVVSWNVATAPNDEIARGPLPRRSAAPGVTPLVTFEHARGDATICNRRKNRKKAQCKLPTAKQYEAALRKFKARSRACATSWPGTRSTTSRSRPTRTRRPPRSSRDRAQGLQGRRPSSRPTSSTRPTTCAPSARRSARRPATSRRSARPTRARAAICGVHNYSDTNRFRSTGTKAIIKALGCKQIWLTEAGGLYKFVGYKAARAAS